MNQFHRSFPVFILLTLTSAFGFGQSGQTGQSGQSSKTGQSGISGISGMSDISARPAGSAASGRVETDLSGKGWNLWLDHGALWYNDNIYLPPVIIDSLPVNPPTIGWERLHASSGMSVNVPGTVEEHYWGAIGGAIPDTGG